MSMYPAAQAIYTTPLLLVPKQSNHILTFSNDSVLTENPSFIPKLEMKRSITLRVLNYVLWESKYALSISFVRLLYKLTRRIILL